MTDHADLIEQATALAADVPAEPEWVRCDHAWAYLQPQDVRQCMVCKYIDSSELRARLGVAVEEAQRLRTEIQALLPGPSPEDDSTPDGPVYVYAFKVRRALLAGPSASTGETT